MRDIRTDRVAILGTSVLDRILRVAAPRHDPPDLVLAAQAMDRRQFADAERHLRRALDTDPESDEVRALMGILHERLGEHHAAYQCYRIALQFDQNNPTARDGLRRYCERFGYDLHSRAINPALRPRG